MDHRLRILKLTFVFLLLVGVLFGALALFPALAQTPQHRPTASDDPFAPGAGDVSAQLLLPSQTGYLIDDGAAGFTYTLASGQWSSSVLGGYNNDYLYTAANNDGDYAQWKPDLALGLYEVLVHYYAHSGHYSKAKYTINYDGGVATHYVNQQLKADGSAPIPAGEDSGWRTLGVYRFRAGIAGYVRLSDATTTGGTGTNVVADAVKFAPLEVWVDDNYCSTCPNEGKLWGVTAFDNIFAGVQAVANNGTVRVRAGTYYENITVTKSITLAGAGAATTVITVPSASNAAIEMLASNVTISDFTIESAGAGYGIINHDWTTGWALGLSGYRIANNVIRGFGYGIFLWQARGEISNNSVYNNLGAGIYVQEFPSGASAGPTTVSRNVLYANGAGGVDYDIVVHDSYTGTTVVSNTITGSGGANEAGIYVLNGAGDLTLSSNTVTSCTYGVWILENADLNIQKVNLVSNTITRGATGVRVEWAAGTPLQRQVIIGGSVANSNRIYGNSGYELHVPLYSANITATYNYWGVCTLRGIEDEIYHHYDNPVPSVGTVTYEPALCVPYTITVDAAPTSLPADGLSTSTITATARDAAGNPVRPGTMIGITTSLGSVPYGYVEENDPTPKLVWAGLWPWVGANPHASGGAYVGTSDPTASVRWTFSGTAVSLIYLKQAGSGLADVYVDDFTTPITTINMSSLLTFPAVEWWVEDVITNALGSGEHTIEVRPKLPVVGPIWIDAFRSGGTVATQGRITTALTSATISGTATVWGTVYNGRIILDSTAAGVYPLITDTATVAFRGADVYVSKSASLTTLTPGKEVTYTITYGNSGPEKATNTVITDTLPTNFLYVRYRAVPPLSAPSSVPPDQYVWSIGNLLPGATGAITLVARPDPSAFWPSTGTPCMNVVEIAAKVADEAAGNNITGTLVTVVPGAAAVVTVTANPATILADGLATAVITAEVRDRYNNPVLDGTSITFTTSLTGTTFLPGGAATQVVNTIGGMATTTLQAGIVAGTATITANAGTARGSTQVRLVALEPWWVYISAHPPVIRVSNGEVTTTLRITVTDQYNNLVNGAAVALTTTAGSFPVSGGTTLNVTTTNGIALAGLASSQTVTTATVTAAITTTGRPTATTEVFFKADLPYTITSEASPTLIRVCGETAVVTATIKDRFDNLVEDGTEVTFNIVQGERGDMYPRLTTTVNGVATSTVRTKGYLFGQRFLDVYILARRETQWVRSPLLRIDLEVGLPDKDKSYLTASPSVIEVSGKEARIEVRVRDCAGNKVQDGTVVTFTASSLGTISPTTTTTADGVAFATFRSGCSTGTALITATADSQSFSTTVQIEPGPADLISVSILPGTIRNCSGRAVITAILYDVCHNLVKDNTQVLLTPQYGYVSVSPYAAYTRGGVVTATVTADRKKKIEPSGWPSGLEQINVTSGSALPGFVNLTIVPGGAETITVSADPRSIPINGDVNGYDIIVVAQVADCSGTPVENGTSVRLRTDKGLFRESGGWFFDGTTASGLVTATLTSQSVAGTVTVTATANSAVGTTKVQFLPGEPWLLEVWGYPQSIYADGRSTSRIIARVRDEYHNPVLDGITVTFVTDYGHFANGDVIYTTTTDIDGFAFATLVADTTPRTALVRAIAYNDRQGYTYVFFILTRYVYLPLVIRHFPP